MGARDLVGFRVITSKGVGITPVFHTRALADGHREYCQGAAPSDAHDIETILRDGDDFYGSSDLFHMRELNPKVLKKSGLSEKAPAPIDPATLIPGTPEYVSYYRNRPLAYEPKPPQVTKPSQGDTRVRVEEDLIIRPSFRGPRYRPTEPLIPIGIMGGIGCGKTTAATYLFSRYGFKVVSFAAPFKDFLIETFAFPAHHMYGTQEEKEERLPGFLGKCGWTGRDLLEEVPEYFRGIDSDVWADRALRGQQGRVVFSDVRRSNEAQGIRQAGGIIIQVIRTNYTPPERDSASDRGWRKLQPNLTIRAGSVPELHEEIDKVMRQPMLVELLERRGSSDE